jgi:hypothetical protein
VADTHQMMVMMMMMMMMICSLPHWGGPGHLVAEGHAWLLYCIAIVVVRRDEGVCMYHAYVCMSGCLN